MSSRGSAGEMRLFGEPAETIRDVWIGMSIFAAHNPPPINIVIKIVESGDMRVNLGSYLKVVNKSLSTYIPWMSRCDTPLTSTESTD